MSDNNTFHVAIVGGGLCGLALAVALEKRSISYTIYEANPSFVEIGAGISLGPNGAAALHAIDPETADDVHNLTPSTSTNEESVYFSYRVAADWETFPDGRLICETNRPRSLPGVFCSRTALLQTLAKHVTIRNARFHKKVTRVEQCRDLATIEFEDGSQETASVVIGCDGVHSKIRRAVLGPDHPLLYPIYTGLGVYRVILPRSRVEQVLGEDMASLPSIWMGPSTYFMQYLINKGRDVNFGFWHPEGGDWREQSWVQQRTKAQFKKDLKGWGPKISNLIELVDDVVPYWASFQHPPELDSCFQGRLCIIGDAAHSSTPHLGQGASQAVEDAYVLAEVLAQVGASATDAESRKRVEAAFCAFQDIRLPRFQHVVRASRANSDLYMSLGRHDISEEQLRQGSDMLKERLRPIWFSDVSGQGKEACAKMRKYLHEGLA